MILCVCSTPVLASTCLERTSVARTAVLCGLGYFCHWLLVTVSQLWSNTCSVVQIFIVTSAFEMEEDKSHVSPNELQLAVQRLLQLLQSADDESLKIDPGALPSAFCARGYHGKRGQGDNFFLHVTLKMKLLNGDCKNIMENYYYGM
jgi:hypothetical protein